MHVRPVQSDDELRDILALQRLNRAQTADGFVTVEHTLELLQRMHASSPSIVAYDAQTLAGYALVMPVECRSFLPILQPMFERLDALALQRYYVMGQICVAKPYRGSGVFDALYKAHEDHLSHRYDACVTEVATRNTRSMRAHARVGFTELERYRDATDEWALIAWRWR